MDGRTINCLQSSAGILAGFPEGVLALGSAGMMPTGQPPGRRRYNRRAPNRVTPFIHEAACLAITTVVQELPSLGRSRVAAMRTCSLGRSPRMIGQ